MPDVLLIDDHSRGELPAIASPYTVIPIPRYSFADTHPLNKSTAMTEIAVLIVCFNGHDDLRECLKSVLGSEDPQIRRHVVVVDNASTDDSVLIVRAEFPTVHLLRLDVNTGFAGGNNAGWEFIKHSFPTVRYVALLNQDTIVESGWLSPLMSHLDNHPVVAAAQAKIMLHPKTHQINTLGNEAHFLGFGFTTSYGKTDSGQFEGSSPIDFASGAASMIRADALRRAGLFDDVFFLYLEDADLGWKLRQLGYRIDVVGASKVWHKYAFQRDYRFYYFLERNRWYLLGTYYKMPTLLLLMPAIVAMEIGQLYFAWRKNVLGQKIRAIQFFFQRKNLARLLEQRQKTQRRRLISDRQFTAPFIAGIHFRELNSRVLRAIGNPLLSAYWFVARRLICW